MGGKPPSKEGKKMKKDRINNAIIELKLENKVTYKMSELDAIAKKSQVSRVDVMFHLRKTRGNKQ